METLAVGLVGWASGIVTVVMWAVFRPYAPEQASARAPIGFKVRG